MKQYFVLLFACMALWGCGGQDQIETPPLKIIDQIDFSHVHIRDNFWSPRLAKHTSATLPVCIDQIENQTGRMQNFENAARGTGKHSGIFFDDSDVYKALEGIAYSLINNPDPELEKKADEWIDKIAAAQQPDGYINTFYTLTGQDKRWNNMDKHEMYCAGHMIEAGIVDPTKVTRSALENAASVSAMVLTTESLVADKPEPPAPAAPADPGMGGMY